MNILSNNIYDYYLANFKDLSFDKQFHFASRLYLWDQDVEAAALLKQLRAKFTADDNPKLALKSVYEAALGSPVHGSKNASELRKPYFEKYPVLKTYVTLLFRCIFLQTIYGLDAREEFLKLCPREDVENLVKKLLEDSEAVAILSTHAINFFYLYGRLFKTEQDLFTPETFLVIGKKHYNLADPIHLQLLIYLYTHCIIGESMFYYRAIPAEHIHTYHSMLEELETIIDARFADINLDNKHEFLVCAKLVGFTSHLGDRIDKEALRSLSDDGHFIIDTHNNNGQIENITFDKSEHRNTLCIIAHRTFTPIAE